MVELLKKTEETGNVHVLLNTLEHTVNQVGILFSFQIIYTFLFKQMLLILFGKWNYFILFLNNSCEHMSQWRDYGLQCWFLDLYMQHTIYWHLLWN